ncbi:unnamed protein product [Vitrella brassicaformis CCMP3155]|uniref:Aspartyl/asparaginy/proline hydroxylase domain-containing protein n=1 Tax=Vitrella brassicaformis (strain CCMP3155) TaxID=1169540 RepID=A0A0G4FEZ5_VITBC|nr:unnamed protein product [Vitrella brassicaformis CCMP3155]|mmetsp:Transcript_101/g.344  ORF Transcript_101/g.344 Transcript_101/m.344 type:complete len:332 (-) Transcript_101:8-1003(-)|eukprot:CEM11600.1 unnamed protein product [Vitrella brassicaformis CCMP3155]
MGTLEERVRRRMEEVMDEYLLPPLHRAAFGSFVRRCIADGRNDKCERARAWLLQKMGIRRPVDPHPSQRGCPEIIPQLTPRPVWPADMFPFISQLEALHPVIKEELLALRGRQTFQPYRGPIRQRAGNDAASSSSEGDGVPGQASHEGGDWNVLYLLLHNQPFPENVALCPRTVEFIQSIPRQYCHALFSAMTPGTHIRAHNGPTNKKLRIHLPIMGLEGTRLRVGDQTITPTEGRCYVFDDSFSHEVWHDGPVTRFVLIIDMWHPDLSAEEVVFFTMLRNSRLRGERQMVASGGDPDRQTLYSLIEGAAGQIEDDMSWWSMSINRQDTPQ